MRSLLVRNFIHGGQYVCGITPGHNRNAIVVGNDDITWLHGNAATGDGNPNFSGAVLIAATNADRPTEHRKVEGSNRTRITNRTVDHDPRNSPSQRGMAHDLAKHGMRRVSAGRHHQHVSWACNLKGIVHHQVVAWPGRDSYDRPANGHP